MQQTPQHYLPARYYVLLGTYLAELGIDVTALLRDAGIDATTLAAPEAQLRPEQVDALVALAAQRSGRSDLGFEFGRRIKLSSHDILGYAMLSAPTLDYALRLLARYFGLITPTYRMQYRSDAQRAEASFQPALPLSAAVLAFHMETIVVAYYEEVKVLLSGDLPACAIYLPFAPPPHAARYAELHTAVVHFSHHALPGARVVLERDVAQRPLAMADDGTVRMAEKRCAALLNTIAQRSSLGDWVRMMLGEVSEGQPALEELANILNLSARTLERRLAQEGHSFRELSRQARHQRACSLLLAGRLSVTQIAYQLGYGDAANFTRAFRREAGTTPSAFRQEFSATAS